MFKKTHMTPASPLMIASPKTNYASFFAHLNDKASIAAMVLVVMVNILLLGFKA